MKARHLFGQAFQHALIVLGLHAIMTTCIIAYDSATAEMTVPTWEDTVLVSLTATTKTERFCRQRLNYR